MAIERSLFLEIVKDAYSAYYTIIPAEETELPLAFRADYNAQDERYFLTKSASIWRIPGSIRSYIACVTIALPVR